MRDPIRILKKLLGPETAVEPFAETGEPLQQTVVTFRDVVKCRKIRDFIQKQFGLNLALSPEVFQSLLNIHSRASLFKSQGSFSQRLTGHIHFKITI